MGVAVAKKPQKLPQPVIERIKKEGLPTGGRFPFVPKIRTNRRGNPDLVTAFPRKGPKKGEKGFVDAQGNIWIRDPAHAGFPAHWDVQKDDGDDYERVGDDGNPVTKIV
jgi:hypothetical protein